jgi:putative membrane protein
MCCVIQSVIKTKHMNVSKLLAVGSLVAASCFSACKSDDPGNYYGNMSQMDYDFIRLAAHGNVNEIVVSKVADSNTNTPEIVGFATKMVQDHQMAQYDLMRVAQAKDIQNLPNTPDPEHEAMANMLRTLTGRALDSTYIHLQVADHAKTIQLFEQELATGTDPLVRGYADRHLPAIRMHHHMADSIAQMY